MSITALEHFPFLADRRNALGHCFNAYSCPKSLQLFGNMLQPAGRRRAGPMQDHKREGNMNICGKAQSRDFPIFTFI
jgi:hypothetical protein